jgi:hypothetical protein
VTEAFAFGTTILDHRSGGTASLESCARLILDDHEQAHRMTARALAIALAATWASTAARADEAWTDLTTKNGVLYQKRAVAGSKYFEYRATTAIAIAPRDGLRIVWKVVTELQPPMVSARQVLKRSDEEVVVYDQIKTPVVSDRDVTTRFQKVVVPPDRLEVRFQSSEQLGPPPDARFVRLPMVRGAWTLVEAPGGARVTYQCYSEPGGSVPAFIIRSAQQDQVATDVERMLPFLRGR